MTDGAIRVMIAIPVYNHAEAVRAVVEKAKKVSDHVLVVDDGSNEEVREKLSGLEVKVIRHEANRGKGAAILTALEEALRLGMTHVITIDADGQHDPADVKNFLPVLAESPKAIVIGKRDFEHSDAPRSSRFGRSFSNFWFRLQTGHQAGDAQSGFRAYPVDVVDRLHLRERGYPFEVEVLVRASWGGVEIRSVDISVHYPPACERISHFHFLHDNVRLSLLNARLTMRSIVPWPHRKITDDELAAEKISVLSPVKAIRMLLSEHSSPMRLAASGALGMFVGTTPIMGLHTVSILMLASFLRLNRVAALSTSQLCMPPIVPALCIETGYYLRNGRFLTEVSLQTLGYEGLERIYEWVIGSLVLAPLLAAVIGAVIYLLAIVTQREAHQGAEG